MVFAGFEIVLLHACNLLFRQLLLLLTDAIDLICMQTFYWANFKKRTTLEI